MGKGNDELKQQARKCPIGKRSSSLLLDKVGEPQGERFPIVEGSKSFSLQKCIDPDHFKRRQKSSERGSKVYGDKVRGS